MSRSPMVATDEVRGVVAIVQGFGDVWLDLDTVISLLQTVGVHLEEGRGGSRFPQLWRLAFVLAEEPSYKWSGAEVDDLVRELETIEEECASVPASVTPTFLFGDEGNPDVYFHETPWAKGTAQALFHGLLGNLRGIAAEAQHGAQGLVIERRGPLIEWWRS